jgi:hypothetical protein
MLGLVGTMVMYGVAIIVALWILQIVLVIFQAFCSWLDTVI